MQCTKATVINSIMNHRQRLLPNFHVKRKPRIKYEMNFMRQIRCNYRNKQTNYVRCRGVNRDRRLKGGKLSA